MSLKVNLIAQLEFELVFYDASNVGFHNITENNIEYHYNTIQENIGTVSTFKTSIRIRVNDISQFDLCWYWNIWARRLSIEWY